MISHHLILNFAVALFLVGCLFAFLYLWWVDHRRLDRLEELLRIRGIKILLLAMLSWTGVSHAEVHRNHAVRLSFLRHHGLSHTPIGCQVDHIQPLHCGGPDVVANLQLICGEYLREKERAEPHCNTLPAWLIEHPCAFPSCVR